MKTIRLKWEVIPQNADDAKGVIYDTMSPFGGYSCVIAYLADGKKSIALKKPWSIFQGKTEFNTFEDVAEECQKDFQEHIEKGFEFLKSELKWERIESLFLLKTPLGLLKIQYRKEGFLPVHYVNDAMWIDTREPTRPCFSSLDEAKKWCLDEFTNRLSSSIDVGEKERAF